MEAHSALVARWKDAPPLGVPERTVSELEVRYGLSIPTDFRLYLVEAVPAANYMDDIGITWWAADSLKNIPEECPAGVAARSGYEAIQTDAAQFLVFADFLVWCYAYAICCSPGENRGKIALIADDSRFVAHSFSHFVKLALDDASEIHNGATTRGV